MKTRSVTIVLITLIIGFVLGMLTSAQLRMHKMKPMRVFFSEERFREGFYKIIQPDDQQKVDIDKILDKYAKINGDIQGSYRKEIEASIKEFRKEIDSKLTKEQITRLREMDEKRQEMIRQNRRNHENDSIDHRYNRYHDNRPPYRDRPPFEPGPDSTRLPDNK